MLVFLAVLLLLGSGFLPGEDTPDPGEAALNSSQELQDDTIVMPLRDSNGSLIWVQRRDRDLENVLRNQDDPDPWGEARLRAAVRAALDGPDYYEGTDGLSSALPEGIIIDEIRVRGDQGGFFVTLPVRTLNNLTPDSAQALSEIFLGLDFNVPSIRRHVLMIRDPADGLHYPLDHFLPRLPPVPPKPSEEEVTEGLRATGQPPAPGQGQPAGYLSGKSIFLNPGHGWYYDSGLGRWATQRGNTNNIVEDLSNAEAVDTYLVHYLWNAGAGVYTCRERDMNDNMVIVDNGDPGYSETGSWTTITSADAHDGNYRQAGTSSTETATATFTPTIPEAGDYYVSIWYIGGSSNASDAQITVRHTGGETVITRNMEVDGYTFRYLGRFHFNAGSSLAAGSVVVSNVSGESSNFVVADAVRFGGGTGAEQPFGEPFPSNWPRFEEAGPYFANFMGCPSATCGTSTVTAMPRYVAWENEGWEDSVYISWHTNAFAGTSRGTSSFAYASGGWDAAFNGVAGSLELRHLVHTELINDLRAAFDPLWGDRGEHTNWYGEINPNYNNETPGVIYEMAFHDNATDALYLQNPYFRMTLARAVYQGIAKYFADRDGDPTYTLLPEPPTHFRVLNSGGGEITLSWNAPPYDTGDGLYGDAAEGYRVYRSFDGRGFDDGTAVTGTTWTDITVPEGTVAYYRVTAANAGGESFPTETLAARASTGSVTILVVTAFDRMDQGLIVVTDDPYSTNALHRGYVDMMNSYRYIISYGTSIDAYGSPFDSVANEAVRDGLVSLSSYGVVIWTCGEESTTDHTFENAEQSLLESYLDSGGNLFVSGSEIGWDLDYKGNGPTFYNTYLKADYAGDDAGTYNVAPVSGSIYDGNAAFFFDDNTFGEYDANYPDQLTPLGGAVAALSYSGGSGGTAGLQYDGGLNRIVLFGFPFETITSASARNETMADILDFFGTSVPDPCEGAIEVDTFPYVDSNTTSGMPSRIDGYSCPPSTGSEAGPEVVYRLTILQPGNLTVSLSDGAGVDIDPHLLAACSPTSCLARHDTGFTYGVTPGTYFLVCDTWTHDSGTQYPGAYTLNLAFSATPGDTTSPAPVGDTLAWEESGTQWTWTAVTLDRKGSTETGVSYRVYRSEDPAQEGEIVATPGTHAWTDTDEPISGCWFYHVEAVDGAGNRELAVSVYETIVDNPDAVFSGTWTLGTSSTDKWGENYRYIATGGTGASTAAWSFPVRERGLYQVSVYYPQGTNRSTEARFTIQHAGGTTLVPVDQSINGGQWVTLQTRWLEPDGSYPVVLDDAEPGGKVVIADAVRWIKETDL